MGKRWVKKGEERPTHMNNEKSSAPGKVEEK